MAAALEFVTVDANPLSPQSTLISGKAAHWLRNASSPTTRLAATLETKKRYSRWADMCAEVKKDGMAPGGQAMTYADLEAAICDLQYRIVNRFDRDKTEEYSRELERLREQLRALQQTPKHTTATAAE